MFVILVDIEKCVYILLICLGIQPGYRSFLNILLEYTLFITQISFSPAGELSV